MALAETQQAITILRKARHILLLVPEKPSVDAFASMVALYVTILEHHTGEVEAVSPSHVPPQLQFLSGSSQTHTEPTASPEIILDIAGPTNVQLGRTEQLNGGVRLHIELPSGQTIQKDDIEMHVRHLSYDAIVTFGTSDLEALGELFTKHADFFYSTPIINVDNKANNEHFGAVNLVDITRSSIAEVTHELITELTDADITTDVATNLYAGIVGATESFQKPSTTPHAFELAAELMEKNADKETVIQNLVKTKPFHLLKLTGRLYARLRHDEHGKLFWSILRPVDFTESGASHEHIPDAMHELTNNISGFNAAFLLHEQEPNSYTTYFILGKGLLKQRREIQEQLNAHKENGAMTFKISATSLEEAEQSALDKIRAILP